MSSSNARIDDSVDSDAHGVSLYQKQIVLRFQERFWCLQLKPVRHCDKTTTDTAKHVGAFEQPYGKPRVYQDNGETFEALQCAACGNTVIRKVAKTQEPNPNLSSVS
jgi:hypothetical protein